MEATRVTPEINNIFKEINDTGGQMAFYSAQFNPLLPKLTQALGEHLLDPPKENRNGLPNLHRQTRRYEPSFPENCNDELENTLITKEY